MSDLQFVFISCNALISVVVFIRIQSESSEEDMLLINANTSFVSSKGRAIQKIKAAVGKGLGLTKSRRNLYGWNTIGMTKSSGTDLFAQGAIMQHWKH